MFEDLEDDEFLEDEAFEGQGGGDESGNRTFIIAAIGLGALTIIALLCVGIYLFQQSRSGSNRAAQQTQAVELAMQNTREAEIVQMTVEAQSWTATPTALPAPSETPAPTEVVVLPTATLEAPETQNPATATVAALLTQAAGQPTQGSGAIATITVVVTELPNTGLFDDLNVTGMILLAFFALVVIFLARRMRTAGR